MELIMFIEKTLLSLIQLLRASFAVLALLSQFGLYITHR